MIATCFPQRGFDSNIREMKILHTVEQYVPSIGGMQEVVQQLSERLVRAGHDVTVATSHHPDRASSVINGVRVVGFEISGNAVNGYRWGDVESYRRFLLQGDFDVMANFAAQQWATDIALSVLPQLRCRKVFVPTGFSALYDSRYRDYFLYLADRMRNYDAHVFLSDDYRDINFAREHGIENLNIIPNGASEEEFLSELGIDIRARLGIPRDDFVILHVGSHTGMKGHRELMALFSLARIRNTTLLLVGNDYVGGCGPACRSRARTFRWLPFYQPGMGRRRIVKRLLDGQAYAAYGRHKRMLVTSLTRAETVAAYRSADLFLFPSNIECSPIVLFECMAARLPFLTSEVGNAREIIAWSSGGMLLPTRIRPDQATVHVEESARLLEEVWANAAKRRDMGDAGHRAWKDRFTWENIARRYARLYESVVGA